MDQKLWSDESEFVEVVNTTSLGPEAQRIVDHLHSRVIGQDRAIEHIGRSLEIYHSGLKEPTQPIAAMLFAGPTGVGKTYVAQELGRAIIGDSPKPPIYVVQCGKFKESHRISELVGSPPGYIGSKDMPGFSQTKLDGPHFWAKATPILQEKYKGTPPKDIDRVTANLYQQLRPYTAIVLLDEIEKAHTDLQNLLLHIIDEGELILANGETADFSNAFIIMTCNLGGKRTQQLLSGKTGHIGFRNADEVTHDRDSQAIYEITKQEVESFFAPEFIGRIRSEIIVFRPLEMEHCRQILEIQLQKQQDLFTGAEGRIPLLLRFSQGFKDAMLEIGFDRTYGMRPLKRTVNRYVRLPLSSAINTKGVIPGDEVLFKFENGKTVICRLPRPAPPIAPRRVYIPGPPVKPTK